MLVWCFKMNILLFFFIILMMWKCKDLLCMQFKEDNKVGG